MPFLLPNQQHQSTEGVPSEKNTGIVANTVAIVIIVLLMYHAAISLTVISYLTALLQFQS